MGMEFWNQWWVWASIAFFAPPISLFWLGVIFAVLSLIAWIILRNTFKLKTGQVKTFDEDING